MDFMTILDKNLMEDQLPITAAYLSSCLNISLKEGRKKLSEYYYSHYENIKSYFTLSILENEDKVRIIIIDQNQLTEILSNPIEKAKVFDLTIFALSPNNIEYPLMEDYFVNSSKLNENLISCLTNSLRKMDIQFSNSNNNNNYISNQNKNEEKLKKNPECESKIPIQPVLKKPKFEESQISKKNITKIEENVKNNKNNSKVEKINPIPIIKKENIKKNTPPTSEIIKKDNDFEEEEYYYGMDEKNVNKTESIENIKEKEVIPIKKTQEQLIKDQPIIKKENNIEEEINKENVKDELIAKTRKIKKTVEEIDAKGKYISKDIWVEEIYYEKRPQIIQHKKVEIEKNSQKNNAPPKNQPNIMNFFKKN